MSPLRAAVWCSTGICHQAPYQSSLLFRRLLRSGMIMELFRQQGDSPKLLTHFASCHHRTAEILADQCPGTTGESAQARGMAFGGTCPRFCTEKPPNLRIVSSLRLLLSVTCASSAPSQSSNLTLTARFIFYNLPKLPQNGGQLWATLLRSLPTIE